MGVGTRFLPHKMVKLLREWASTCVKNKKMFAKLCMELMKHAVSLFSRNFLFCKKLWYYSFIFNFVFSQFAACTLNLHAIIHKIYAYQNVSLNYFLCNYPKIIMKRWWRTIMNTCMPLICYITWWERVTITHMHAFDIL